jgi:hypothetical protein
MAETDEARVTLVLSLDGIAETRIIEFDVGEGAITRDVRISQQTLGVFAVSTGYLLLLEAATATAAGKPASSRSVLGLKPDTVLPSVPGQSNYVYHIDRATGVLQTYLLQQASGSGSGSGEVHEVCNSSRQCTAQAKINALPVATAYFPPEKESIVDITVPTVGDAVNSATVSLNDDSVFVKYLNRNTVLVTTQVRGGGGKPALYTTLVDTASAKIVYRAVIDSGSTPVSATMTENNIAVFYWNCKAKRSEVSSISLYDGFIDSLGLTPFASRDSAAKAAKLKEAVTFSSFTSVPPVAKQRTYVMPKAVTTAHHTTTIYGITNKNPLVGLASGQVYMLDSRQLSPRRPLTEPTASEKADGMQIYTPYLQLFPLQAITHNYAMANGPTRILSAPSRLESSSMVFAFGHPDLHFNRVLPSADFDLLASDFNYGLLTLLLLALGAIVMYLQKAQRSRVTASTWA